MLKVENQSNIIILLDRSGSMQSIASDVRGSIQNFILEQQKQKDSCVLTLIQFDSQNDQEIIFKQQDISKIKYDPTSFSPRGMTPLWSAIGKAIDSHKDIPKDEKVVFVIVTDGQNNIFGEYSSEKVKELVKEKENNGWVFVYLGANVDAFAEGNSMGLSACNTVSYNQTSKSVKKGINKLSDKVSSYRSIRGPGGQSVMSFSEEDREDISN